MTPWTEIVRQHGPTVWGTVFRLLGNRQDAEDCFQDTFVSALTFARRTDVDNWPGLLRRLATTRALDLLRKRQNPGNRCTAVPDWSSMAGTGPSPEQEAEASELRERVRSALAKLPAQQAQAICLYYLEGMSYREVADQLGIDTATVGAHLHRARLSLRAMLTQAFSESDTFPTRENQK